MSTLLMRLAAPMQSWGVDSKFDRRGTERIPTKSGVLGLVAAALGLRRNEKECLEDLRALRFGVRVDREGVLLRDYHTVKSKEAAYVTNRYYLADAVFLAGLEGDDALLDKIESALRRPVFPLFLGRRSCPPEGRLLLGVRAGKSLLEALREEPWLVSDRPKWRETQDARLRIVTDSDENDAYTYFQRDDPVSFDQIHRKFGFRRVAEHVCVIDGPNGPEVPAEFTTEHDPILELEED